MRCLVGSFLVSLTLAGFACGSNLRIVGCDVAWRSLTDPTPICYALIVNETGTLDRLAAWQLCLTIFPVDGATGWVGFASADLPRDPTEDYLLAGDSGVLDVAEPPPAPLVAGPTDTLLLGDYAQSVIGEAVPSSPKTLLRMEFCASDDAQGGFAVAAVPGPENSFWASWDTNDCPDMMRGFENVPFDGGATVIGRITVGILVPEPCDALLLFGGATTTGAFLTRRRRVA